VLHAPARAATVPADHARTGRSAEDADLHGEVRKVILKHLGHRFGRRFADHWEFVAYARSHDLKLDLTTPPVRYRAAEPAAR